MLITSKYDWQWRFWVYLSFRHPWLSCVYVYRWNDGWLTEERLQAEKDHGIRKDRFAITTVKSSSDDINTTVGHLPRELGRLLCGISWHKGCEVTGRRRRSPLAQGGLEIPCSVMLHGKKSLVARARHIVAGEKNWLFGRLEWLLKSKNSFVRRIRANKIIQILRSNN